MYRQVILFLQEQKIQDFDFLKDNPTKVYKKNEWYALIYYEPLGENLTEQVSPKMLIKLVTDHKGLEDRGWKLVRNYPISKLQGDLLEFLQLYETYKFRSFQNGYGLEFNGPLLEFVAYGLNDRTEVSTFLRMMMGAGYDLEIIIQIFSNIVKKKSLARDFVELINRYEVVV